jgi:ABC-2 type transport system permease protein
LPISRGAVVIGRTFGDALLNILVLTVMAAAGYAVGWRPTSGGFSIFLALKVLNFPGPSLSGLLLDQLHPSNQNLLKTHSSP